MAHIIDINELCAYACEGELEGNIGMKRFKRPTIGLMSGWGTASNLWYSNLSSGPMLMYAPLFSVVSQYLGAEKTISGSANMDGGVSNL